MEFFDYKSIHPSLFSIRIAISLDLHSSVRQSDNSSEIKNTMITIQRKKVLRVLIVEVALKDKELEHIAPSIRTI